MAHNSRRKANASRPRRERPPLLSPDVDHVDYKDVALLRGFISERGKIRARCVTGITVAQQREVAAAVKNAREMALLPYSLGHGRSR
jgi:small subunit ribosomal protein S18